MKKGIQKSFQRDYKNSSTFLPDELTRYAQTESILFILDDLKKEIRYLNKTIQKANVQSQRTERSNFRLNFIITILTAVATSIAVYSLAESTFSSWLQDIPGFHIPKFIISLLSTFVVDIFLYWIGSTVEKNTKKSK